VFGSAIDARRRQFNTGTPAQPAVRRTDKSAARDHPALGVKLFDKTGIYDNFDLDTRAAQLKLGFRPEPAAARGTLINDRRLVPRRCRDQFC